MPLPLLMLWLWSSLPAPAIYNIAAELTVLQDTLTQRGWQFDAPLCTAEPLAISPCWQHAMPLASHPVWSLQRWDLASQTMQQALLWSAPTLHPTPHRLPTWRACVPLPDAPDGNNAAVRLSLDPQAALRDDLLSGIAVVHTADKLAAASAAVRQAVPTGLIELRHAPGEIDRYITTQASPLWCAAPPTHNASGAQVSLLPWMPPVEPLHEALVDTLIWRDNADDQQIALTFDACSTFDHGAYSSAVIDTLIRENIPATLFIGGHWAETHPDVLRFLAQQPQFELGNHTYSHPHMTQLSPGQQREELLWTQYLIYSSTGVMPRLYRPPYGEVDDEMIYAAARLGLYTVEFDVPAGDADTHVSLARLTAWILRKATAGSIVVMHMNHPNFKTAAVLPQVIPQLKARGYRFAKVSELLSSMQQRHAASHPPPAP